MAEKVGRNDPCPCGSGKKYKRCCLGKMETRDEIRWPTFREEVVLAELLTSCKEFAAFYRAERNKIVGDVHWAQDLSLPEGIDYRSTRLRRGAKVIRLRRVPAVVEDATKIAHELEHLVLDAEGFPLTGATAKYEDLSSALNSMVQDPVVNCRLAQFGFDLREDYEKELEETVRQLESVPAAPGGRLDRTRWMFNYVGNVLESETIYARDEAGWDRFQQWFDARYADLAREAQDLLAVVRTVGHDTPGKQRVLLREVVRRYKLDRWIHL